MRADAQRNRDKIVAAAREVFREQGYDASLDLVAKRAGVGAGTLYRHFPARENLVDAIMQSWVDRVVESTDAVLAQQGPSRELLLSWATTYAGLISLHKGGPAKITTAMGDQASPIATKCDVLLRAGGRVLAVLDERSALRPGVDALQLARLLGAVATVADQGDLEPDAVRPLLEVVVDGLLAPVAAER